MSLDFFIMLQVDWGIVTDAFIYTVYIHPHASFTLLDYLSHLSCIGSPEQMRLSDDLIVLSHLLFLVPLHLFLLGEQFVLVWVWHLGFFRLGTNELWDEVLSFTTLLLDLHTFLVLGCQTLANALQLTHQVRTIIHILRHVFLLSFKQLWKLGEKLLCGKDTCSFNLVCLVQAEVLQTLDGCLVLP
jgi:hypothetical protein